MSRNANRIAPARQKTLRVAWWRTLANLGDQVGVPLVGDDLAKGMIRRSGLHDLAWKPAISATTQIYIDQVSNRFSTFNVETLTSKTVGRRVFDVTSTILGHTLMIFHA